MKKLWKMFLAVAVMSIAICLFVGTAVFAETKGGELCEGFSWSFDTESKTLTLKGEGDVPEGVLSYQSFPWKDDVNDIQYIYLDGITSSGSVNSKYSLDKIQTISGRYGKDITWQLDIVNQSFTVEGTGEAEASPWNFLVSTANSVSANIFYLKTAVFGQNLTKVASVGYVISTLDIGKTDYAFMQGCSNVNASPDNPYFSTYDGALYTKGFKKLLYYPVRDPLPKFHPDLKIIGAQSLSLCNETVILPWGVTTIEEDAVYAPGYRPNVVLPDTVTSMLQNHAGGKDCSVIFTYSKSNTAVGNVIGGQTDYYNRPLYHPVDSLAEYYPDVPEARGQSSTPVSEPSQPLVSQPESSQNTSAVSQPESSRPSSNSSTSSQTPTTPSSQSSASSVTSSQPVSKPASEPTLSSQPEESSMPEESSAVSEAPSSEVSVSEPESSSPEESELSGPSAPAEQSGGFSSLWPLFLVLGAAVVCAGVIIFLIWRKRH